MTNFISLPLLASSIAAISLLNSCAYDPGRMNTTVGSTYRSSSEGYGSRAVSSAVFVSTGNSRWGYDPSCYSYYDYNRRAYYDPYLNGYYPVGYRPPVVYGVSHPHGWRPGAHYCQPPTRVTNLTISNYRNREATYRSAGYISNHGITESPNQHFHGRGQQPTPNRLNHLPHSPTYPSRHNPYHYNSPSRPQMSPRPTFFSRDRSHSNDPSHYRSPVNMAQPSAYSPQNRNSRRDHPDHQ